MSISRRASLTMLGLGVVGAVQARGQGLDFATRSREGMWRYEEEKQISTIEQLALQPIVLTDLQLWRLGEDGPYIVRALGKQGEEGIVRASVKVRETIELFKARIRPQLVGQDVRQLPRLVGSNYTENYEFASLPYWSAFGQAELAIWDLIGVSTGLPCHRFLGKQLRTTVPMYLSANRRDTSAEEEIEHLGPILEKTGCRGVKLKIARRMGRNTDMYPGRTETMLRLFRKSYGDALALYVDANGAYDSAGALALIPMLKEYGVSMFEEPCPYEEYEMTAQVTAKTDLLIAGGEQDTSMPQWRRHAEGRTWDILQPDPAYNGGLLRTLMVQKISLSHKLLFEPHFPRSGADTAPLLHLCAVAENLHGLQEYRSRPPLLSYEHEPRLEPRGGVLEVPKGPGLGIRYGASIWKSATRIV